MRKWLMKYLMKLARAEIEAEYAKYRVSINWREIKEHETIKEAKVIDMSLVDIKNFSQLHNSKNMSYDFVEFVTRKNGSRIKIVRELN